MPEHDEVGFGIVMPFVVVTSKGGPYDDAAYVAGYEAGVLQTRFDSAEVLLTTTITCEMPFHTENIPQLDLIAMRNGWTVESEDAGDGWTYCTFRRVRDTEAAR